MSQQQDSKKLEAMATELLRKAGFKANGQPKRPVKTWDTPRGSIHCVSTPMGGQPGYRRH